MSDLPIPADKPFERSPEQQRIRADVLKHEAEVRERSRLNGPLTLRSLIDILLQAPSELMDIPIVVPDDNQKVFVQLYAANLLLKPSLASGVYDVPPNVPGPEHTKFYAHREGIVFGFKNPAWSLGTYWDRQDHIVSVWGPKRDTGDTARCAIHNRLWPTDRWPECPHCLRASGLTPEEVRARMIK